MFEAGQRISEEKIKKGLQNPALDQVLNPGARRFHAGDHFIKRKGAPS